MTICVADAPLEALKIGIASTLRNYCHLWFGNDEIWRCGESKLNRSKFYNAIDVVSIGVEANLNKEGWILGLFGYPRFVVETGEVLILWVEVPTLEDGLTCTIDSSAR